MNRRVRLGAVALLLTAGTVLGQVEAPKPTPAYQAIITDYDASEEPWNKRYETFKPRFEEFCREHPGTPDELRARIWLLRNTWWQRADGTMHASATEIAKDILKRHAESPLLNSMVDADFVYDDETRAMVYAALMKSPHRHVKAAGHLGLAGRRAETEEQREHLVILLDSFADVPYRGGATYGAIADARLNPHPASALAVGQPAPEIEGLDEKERAMKLSDYKGKVVLLDFWGDW